MANYRVRPFSHVGHYPNGDIEIGGDLLFQCGPLLFSCVRNQIVTKFGRSEADQPVFELDNWTLQKIRFFASVFFGNGSHIWVRLYPLPPNQDLFLESSDDVLSDAHLLLRVIGELKTNAYLMDANYGLVPNSVSDYQKSDWGADSHRRAITFWKNLDIGNLVLMRGIHSLLKSEMLFNHFQFRDAALSASHISLDGAFNVVLAILRDTGMANPTSKDAQEYVEGIFGWEKSGTNFYEDYYDDRIRNFHTDSRFGAEAIPHFSIDDIWHLNRHLKTLFFKLVTGESYDDD